MSNRRAITRKGDFAMKKILLVASVLLAMALPSFSQTMPLERTVGIPARTGNSTCLGASGTVAMTPTQVSELSVTGQSGALTCTTPTATQLCTLFPFVGGSAANFHWDMYLINAGTGTVTVALGTGVTNPLTGTLTVAAGSVKHFLFVLTNCVAGSQAAQLISLGTSVF
jgi:hypothetical protein